MTNLSYPQKILKVNSPNPKIRILIVDDQNMIREGLKALIQTESNLEVVGIAHNGRDGIKQVAIHQPDIVLMDLEMPTLDGASATKIICQKFPHTKVLVLSTFDTPEYVSRALGSGAMGYLLKGTPPRELINVIRSIHLGYAQIGPSVYQNLPLVNSKKNLDSKISLSSSATSNSNQSIVRQLSPRLSKQANTTKQKNNSALTLATRGNLTSRQFEQTVMLRPSPKWSRFTVWSVVSLTLFAIVWAAVAKIEQVVPATGQLKPEGNVKEVQIPTSGVIEEVLVEEGEKVEKGETLLVLDSTTSKARLASLNNIRRSLTQENNFYRNLMEDKIDPNEVDKTIVKIEIPREITFLARDRARLQEENELLNVLLGIDNNNLTSQQQTRLTTYRVEVRSRTAAARLKVEQLQKQLNQNRVQLADAREQLATARQVLNQID